MIRLIANILAFEIGWSACIVGAARGLYWLGPVVVGVIAALTLATDTRPAREAIVVIAIASGGLVLDTLLLSLGLLDMSSGPRLAGAPLAFFPVFFAMWLNFALLLNVSLKWLRKRWALAGALGAISAPPTYWFAQRLGAVTLTEPLWITLAAVGAQYALAVPGASWLAWRIREGAARGLAPVGAGGQTP